MSNAIRHYFGLERAGTTWTREIVAGATTFVTMSYIVAQAYGPALIVVGLLMLSPITKIRFEDFTESIPAFAVVSLMSFTYNIGVGITAGFVLYPFCKLVSGRAREIEPGLWVLAGLSLLFFVSYPYT